MATKYHVPDNECDRLAALRRYKILDTDHEENFDRLARIAASCLGVPIALVSLIDAHRQWSKASYGLALCEAPRELTFCSHTIVNKNVFIVEDAKKDPRFADNPFVTEYPHIRFYAGAPLTTKDGFVLGALCCMDRKPREITKEQKQVLADLARIAIDEMELRLDLNMTADKISARKSAEGKARDIAERNRAIVDAVVDGIITINEGGVIDSLNPAAETIFGYRGGEVIGRDANILMAEPYLGEHDGYLPSLLKTEHGEIIGIGREMLGRRYDGSTFPMELAVSEMAVNGRRMFTAIVRDITERKEIESLKNEFISTVSHELRTPLTSIKGSLGLIRAGVTGEIPEQLKSMLDIAYKNSDRLVDLINDILDSEKVEAGKMDFKIAQLDLVKLARQAVEANHGYAEEFGVTFAVREEVPEALVRGDQGRLLQVVANFLSNAAKFAPRGSVVEVVVTRSDNRCKLSVTDKGPGIPAEFHDKIFERFCQADSSDTRQKAGTGLGLSISKAIVEMHEGTVGFDTKVGKGTTFYFDLREYVENQLLDQLLTKGAQRPRVLVCEDDKDSATLISMILEQGGFAAEIARSAEDAEMRLARAKYAAMTLDLRLPDKNGIKVLRELHESRKNRNLPIVVVSAKASNGAKEIYGQVANVVDWIQKPIDESRLLEALRSALQTVSSEQMRVLHVEDDDDVSEIVSQVLRGKVSVIQARSCHEAEFCLSHHRFDLVILDALLHDGSAERLLPLLRQDGNDSPAIIIFSGTDVSHGLAAKAHKVLVKSQTTNEELLKAIRCAMKAKNRSTRGPASASQTKEGLHDERHPAHSAR